MPFIVEHKYGITVCSTKDTLNDVKQMCLERNLIDYKIFEVPDEKIDEVHLMIIEDFVRSHAKNSEGT